ncbi:MAG: hypothetical protein ACYDFU_02525 [Nitrospirota bacterium]
MTLKLYDQNRIALEREEVLFVVEEASYGTLTEPAGTDALYPIGPISFKQGYTKRDNKEVHNSRGKRKPITGRLPHGTFTVPLYVKPSGTAGTPPVPWKLLEGLFCNSHISRAADTVQAVPAPTATTFEPGTPANFAASQPVLVQIGTHYELRKILQVAGGVITVDSPFSAAPAGGAIIPAAVGYEFSDNELSYTVWRKEGHSVIVYTGCAVDDISGYKITGNDDVSATFGGGYQREIKCGTDELAVDVASAVSVTVTVQDGRKFDIGARFNLSDGTLTETKLVVTNKALNAGAGPTNPYLTDLTVTRGTGAQAWTAANGIDVYPWLPPDVNAGVTVQGRNGLCELNGLATDILSLELGLKNNINWHEDEVTSTGTPYVASFALAKMRDITAKLQVYFRQRHLGLFEDAHQGTAEEIRHAAYETDVDGNPLPGSVIYTALPQLEFKTPDIGDKNTERVLNIDSLPYESSAMNDEMTMWFL